MDAFGTLSLSDVAWGDEGNYSCYVDNIHMQDVIIKIKTSFSDNTGNLSIKQFIVFVAF